MKFLLPELVAVTAGNLKGLQLPVEREFSFSIDTRTIQAGQVFIALRGQNTDGHAYLGQALEKGACGLIVSDLAKVTSPFAPLHPSLAPSLPFPDPLPESGRQQREGSEKWGEVGQGARFFVIQVEDTLQALQAIAHACRQKHPIPLAAVTGSNGKTTVKDMTAAILATRSHVLKSQKSLNNPIGLPLTLANMTARHELAILEMGMNAPGEIRRLAEIARPNVGAITNIAPAHFGFFHSLEAIMHAKLELFESLPVHGTAVLNTDDALFDQMFANVRCATITFGTQPARNGSADPYIFPEHLTVLQDAKYTFELHTPKGSIPITLPLPGYHNVLNALAATAVAFALQCSELEAIKDGLEHFQPSPMRMQVTTHHDVTLINDAYNANPTSMASALRTLQTFPCTGRKMAVLGDMFELGPISQSAHYEVGKLAAVSVDQLFLLGAYAQDVAQGAQATGMAEVNIFIGDSHEQLAHELGKRVKPGDLILFKASRGMTLEKVIDGYLKILNVE